VTGHALARLLISDDNEHHTPGDLLQKLFRSAQAPQCTAVTRPRKNRATMAGRLIWRGTVSRGFGRGRRWLGQVPEAM
jgi:hypothetical protein